MYQVQAKCKQNLKNTKRIRKSLFSFPIADLFHRVCCSERGQFDQDQASTLPHKRHSDFGGRGGANKRFRSDNMSKSFVV